MRNVDQETDQAGTVRGAAGCAKDTARRILLVACQLRRARWRLWLAMMVGIPAMLTAVHISTATASGSGGSVDRHGLWLLVGFAAIGMVAIAATRLPLACVGSATYMLLWLPLNMNADRSDVVMDPLGLFVLAIVGMQLGLLGLSMLFDVVLHLGRRCRGHRVGRTGRFTPDVLPPGPR